MENEQISYDQWSTQDTARMRRRAYAHPDTGSDLHFTKAARLTAAGDASGAAQAEADGLARVAEIKAAYPYRHRDE
ncbi:MAG TPA: hypothetical protein VK062_05030 [Burkholderiaceae bacterium]|nr:hypothetical protein [Burkholderiaceae bacterium]